MSKQLSLKQRQRSSSGGSPLPLEEDSDRRSVLSKLRNKLSRQRSSQGEDGIPSRHPLSKSSTLPARMTPLDSPFRPRTLPWSVEDTPTSHTGNSDNESVDSGLDPRGGENSGSDSSPQAQKTTSIYDEVAVQRAFGPAMKDLGRWFSQQQRRQYLSLEAAEQERLGSRPPLPIPLDNKVYVAKKPSQDSVLFEDTVTELYDRVQPRLLGSNGLELGLRNLAQHGWYWGPLTRVEAEEKLTGYNDGTFLVRDSSDDRYLLSLSFRSQGKTLHTRIEYCNGYFSFYSFPDSENEGYRSVVELVERSMQYSSVGVFCFSRARAIGSPAVPVRLLKPLSRLTQLHSLQHYCRFVIRQTIRFDSIRQLPLPRHVHSFLEQSQY